MSRIAGSSSTIRICFCTACPEEKEAKALDYRPVTVL